MRRHWYLLVLLAGLISCRKTDSGKIDDHFILRSAGADMPVWVEGNPARKAFLVMLHGGPGGDAQVYNTLLRPFSDEMEKELVMVYWDQRGGGNSAGHFNKSAQDVANCVQDLDRLITVLNIRYGQDIKIYLMGHSWGGTLGTAYLLDPVRQARVRGFIEVDGAHNFLGIPEIVRRFREIGTRQIAFRESEAEWKQILDYCDEVDTLNPSDQDIIVLNQYGFSAERYLIDGGEINAGGEGNKPGTYMFGSSYNVGTANMNLLKTSSAMFQELKGVDYTSRMNELKLPCLFVWGEWDMVVPRELGWQAFFNCGAIDKDYVEFSKSGHSPMINETEGFTRLTLNWVIARL